MDIIYERFDRVRLLTTKHVQWRSHPPAVKPDPKGNWVVAASLEQGLLLTQGQATILIPTEDVRLVQKYDPAWLEQRLLDISQSPPRG